MEDPLEEALAIQREIAALDRVEVTVDEGPPYVVEWPDQWTVTIAREGEETSTFEERECLDDLANENLHDFPPAHAALLREAIANAKDRTIRLRDRFDAEIARLREAQDERPRARELVAKDDARLAAIEAQRAREDAVVRARVVGRRRAQRKGKAHPAMLVVFLVVVALGLAQLLRECR